MENVTNAELEHVKEQRLFLWNLLDNIDTLDDACKNDDALFRKAVREQQKRRWNISTSDGYGVTCRALASHGGQQ